MSKWANFANSAKENKHDVTPHPTFTLRQVVKRNGIVRLEQLIEHRNAQSQVVNIEWVEIPTVYEE